MMTNAVSAAVDLPPTRDGGGPLRPQGVRGYLTTFLGSAETLEMAAEANFQGSNS
jgi:hypothetical protein